MVGQMTLHKWFPAAAAAASSRAVKPTLLSASLQCPSQLARTLDWHTHKHQYGAEEAKSDGGGGGSVVRPGRRRRPQHAQQLPHFGTTGSPTHTNPESSAFTAAMRRRTPVIVSLSIGRTHLDVTLATHPSRMEPVQVLPSIALQHPTRHIEHDNSTARLQRQPLWSPSTIQAQLLDSLAKYMVDDHDPSDASAAAAAAGPISSVSRQRMLMVPVVVAAVLVAWPIQRDTGRCGAACGRVLHYLDHFLYRNGGDGDNSDRRWDFHRGAVVTSESRPLSLAPIVPGLHNIPLCLYSVLPDDLLQKLPLEDEWGRCAALARLPPPTVTQHVASRDQYWTSNDSSSNSDDDDDDDSMSLATRQWLEFGRTHWPQWPILLEPTQQQPLPQGSAVATSTTRALKPRPVVSSDNDGPDDDVRPQRSLSSLARRPTLLSECRRSPPHSRGDGVGPVWAMA
jgi:hypothetical protein